VYITLGVTIFKCNVNKQTMGRKERLQCGLKSVSELTKKICNQNDDDDDDDDIHNRPGD
jgi:hypothetical protein